MCHIFILTHSFNSAVSVHSRCHSRSSFSSSYFVWTPATSYSSLRILFVHLSVHTLVTSILHFFLSRFIGEKSCPISRNIIHSLQFICYRAPSPHPHHINVTFSFNSFYWWYSFNNSFNMRQVFFFFCPFISVQTSPYLYCILFYLILLERTLGTFLPTFFFLR